MSCLRSRPNPLPLGKDPIAQALEDVRGLRRDHPGPYATIAAAIKTELQVQERIAKERPGVLAAIDTFPCEESSLRYNYMMENDECERRMQATGISPPPDPWRQEEHGWSRTCFQRSCIRLQRNHLDRAGLLDRTPSLDRDPQPLRNLMGRQTLPQQLLTTGVEVPQEGGTLIAKPWSRR
jgi:hypothetical protein